MSHPPNASNAAVEDRKITHYLLDPTQPLGGGKAKFFLAKGFTQANWANLKAALLDHARRNEVSRQVGNRYGDKYEVRCTIDTPDGTDPCIVSVWIIQSTNASPRFVTAYPNADAC